MKNIITSTLLSARIWLLTSVSFAIVISVAAAFKNNNSEWILFLFFGCIAALVASIPVLISFFIILPFLQKAKLSWQKKCWYFIGFIFFVTACYGFFPAMYGFHILGFDNNRILSFFTDLLIIASGLFACAMVAVFFSYQKMLDFFSAEENKSYSTIFKQLFYNSKSNTMDHDNTNQEQQKPEEQFRQQTQCITQPAQKTNSHANGILIKGLITGILILIMLIPTFFINNLINERQALQQEVVKEVSSKWANAQTLSAPFITVPYTEQSTDVDGKVVTYKKHLIVLADKLQANGTIFPEARKRSIYKVLLYRSDVNFTGNFKPSWPKDINMVNVDFANARICFGLSDYKGIEEELYINFNNEKILLSPGLPVTDLGEVGVSAPIAISEINLNAGFTFDMQLKIRGSEQLHFLPLSANSKFSITSKWENPSFDGNSLPNERKVSDTGFAAQWNFNRANLPFGTVVREGSLKAKETAFGVSLVQPADQYSKTTRSVKYAILLIGLSFALFFIIELMQKKPLHPVQYVLVGLALVIFYTLLLSIGEYIVFDYAYLSAAAATITLITLYAKSHFDSWKSASIFATLLSCLYCFVFILIRLEDAALLVGSIGLFIILALVMYGSRKINWYGK
jgi:inner membrane protein